MVLVVPKRIFQHIQSDSHRLECRDVDIFAINHHIKTRLSHRSRDQHHDTSLLFSCSTNTRTQLPQYISTPDTGRTRHITPRHSHQQPEPAAAGAVPGTRIAAAASARAARSAALTPTAVACTQPPWLARVWPRQREPLSPLKIKNTDKVHPPTIHPHNAIKDTTHQ